MKCGPGPLSLGHHSIFSESCKGLSVSHLHTKGEKFCLHATRISVFYMNWWIKMINSRLRCGCSTYSGDISVLPVTPSDTRKVLLDFVWGAWGRTGARCHSVWQAMKDKGQQLREDNFQNDMRGRRGMEICRDCIFTWWGACSHTHATFACRHINRWSYLTCVAGLRTHIYISTRKHEGKKVYFTEKTFPLQLQQKYKRRISQSVEYRESFFGLGSFASAAWYQHSTYRHTWVSTHKEHSQTQETQIRKHSNANRHTHTNPCSPEQTHSQVSVHTQQCTFCPSIGLSISNSDSRVLILPPSPPHPPRIPHSRRLPAN